jgi:hypothetical protein
MLKCLGGDSLLWIKIEFINEWKSGKYAFYSLCESYRIALLSYEDVSPVPGNTDRDGRWVNRKSRFEGGQQGRFDQASWSARLYPDRTAFADLGGLG